MVNWKTMLVRKSWMNTFESKSKTIDPNEQFDLCRDKEDNKFLDAVYASKAGF